MRLILTVLFLGFGWLGGCGGGSAETDACGMDAGQFVAVQGDFQPYRSWASFDLGSAPLVGHPTGPRVAYVNHLLPSGASEYPVGTIIVKEIQSGAPSTAPNAYELFAMVKRGGCFNEDGATNWEFFTMRLDATGQPLIIARGTAPTTGDIYSGSTTTCNDCHAATGTAATDHILDPLLQPGHGG